MNVFEDLIIELKEENLLENTVIDEERIVSTDDLEARERYTPVPSPGARSDNFQSNFTDMPERAPVQPQDDFELHVTGMPEGPYSGQTGDPIDIETGVEIDPHAESVNTVVEQAESPTAEVPLVSPQATAPQLLPQNQPPPKNKEFFKKRAINEVSGLQMVEHVLTGVEREYMKVVPKAFDDFRAKKALNAFLQLSDTATSEAHAEAELELLHQTEAWCTVLADRDKNVSVASLRQYCDNTKPALSSQAILAIARFYRNLPYSETVRAKFDFVVTRLFSRLSEHEKRVCLFSRKDTLAHIKTLYADWSSVPLYSAEDDDTTVVMAALSFEDLAVEAENASNFDQLIKTDFFGRLRVFKESLNESFFAPTVTAAAIEANVRIGNAYVVLIARERQKMDAESIQLRYTSLDCQGVSDATAQTLELAHLLDADLQIPEDPLDITPTDERRTEREPRDQTYPAEPVVEKEPSAFAQRILEQFYSVNRWVIVFAVVLLTATLGLVVWSNFFEPSVGGDADGVASITFDNPQIEPYVQKAKVSNSMLYVQLNQSWEALPEDKRTEILTKMYQAGSQKGYHEVNLISHEGQMTGFASATRLEVVMP